jgi:hypothetical protein
LPQGRHEQHVRACSDDRGDDEVDPALGGALERALRGAAGVARLDVVVPAGEGPAIESDDEVGHGDCMEARHGSPDTSAKE